MLSTNQVKVLAVVGAGRSGTTVLASILGEVEGLASAGEIRWLWQRGLLERRPCACGRLPVDCETWGRVVADAGVAGDPGRSGVRRIISAQQDVARPRNLLRVLRNIRQARPGWPSLVVVRSAYGAAVRSFADVSGAHVVVDTSKRPVDAAVLAGLPELDLYVLHMVRDPRAVVHSWRRGKTFMIGGATHSMGTRRLPATVRRWLGNAMSAEALRPQLPANRWMHLRYEDFAEAPRDTIQRILSFLGEEGEPSFVDDHTVHLGPNHIVSGNPSRFTTGVVVIRPDDEWMRLMPPSTKRLVTALTLPLLKRYGYPMLDHDRRGHDGTGTVPRTVEGSAGPPATASPRMT